MKHLQEKRKQKRNRTALLLSGVLCFSIGVLQVEAAPKGPEAEVYVDVITRDMHALLSVTVPTTYAFVVNGTTNTSSNEEISVENQTLQLPNVTIKLRDENDLTKGYEIETSGSAFLPFRNYSTVTAEKDALDKVNFDPKIRQGAAVRVNGYLENEGDNAGMRGNWNAVSGDSSVAISDGNYKNYKILLGKYPKAYAFDQLVQIEGKSDKIWLNEKIDLAASDGRGGYDNIGLANTPFEEILPLDVKVGGRRGQYNSVESSVKAGTIVWSVELQ